MSKPESISRPRWSEHPLWLTAWCVAASFGTYACMYGFRKPFTAAAYTDAPFEVGMKAWLVTAQVLGYMLSKFIGIKVVSEIDPKNRSRLLLALIVLAELALLLFAVVPARYGFLCLFLNVLPLGMVFGLVLGFLEGRRLTEAFVAGLCASFILADGVVKSVGAWLLESGTPDQWMPFTAGLIFLVPLIGFVWMLQQIPPPTDQDVQARSARAPMTKADRWFWIRRHGLGLSLIVIAYLMTTILRSLRADFALELWADLGTTGQPSVFTFSEMWVALGVILSSGLVVFISNNRKALLVSLGIALGGFALLLVALVAQQRGFLSAFPFMVLIGLGLYLPYVVVHTTVFERLIALTKDRGNIGFLMYLADAFGYLGYVILMFTTPSFSAESGFLEQFRWICWSVSIIGILAFASAAWLYTRSDSRSDSRSS